MDSDDIPEDPDLTEEREADRLSHRELLRRLREQEVKLAAQEARLLAAEASEREWGSKETAQRYNLKWLVVGLGIAVITLMLVVLLHLVNRVFWGPFLFVSGAFAVSMIVAPIASITAITGFFFVGTFRKFEDKDVDRMASGVSSAASLARGE